MAIAQVLGPALDGRSNERPELTVTPIPLVATLEVLPCRGGENFLHEVFQPLGYEIEAVRYPLDEQFNEWGQSPYYSLTLSKTTTLSDLLTHLYVLIPVFDNFKLDLACGEGRLLRELLKEKQFEEIVGMDVAFRSLEMARG